MFCVFMFQKAQVLNLTGHVYLQKKIAFVRYLVVSFALMGFVSKGNHATFSFTEKLLAEMRSSTLSRLKMKFSYSELLI